MKCISTGTLSVLVVKSQLWSADMIVIVVAGIDNVNVSITSLYMLYAHEVFIYCTDYYQVCSV